MGKFLSYKRVTVYWLTEADEHVPNGSGSVAVVRRLFHQRHISRAPEIDKECLALIASRSRR